MLNRVILQGRLVADPELKQTAGGTQVCTFTLAVPRDAPNKLTGERVSDFIDVVAWSGTAEFLCNHWGKGDLILINGRLSTRKWTDKEGNSRKGYDVVVDTMYFCGPTKQQQRADGAYQTAQDEEDLPWNDTDLPL